MGATAMEERDTTHWKRQTRETTTRKNGKEVTWTNRITERKEKPRIKGNKQSDSQSLQEEGHLNHCNKISWAERAASLDNMKSNEVLSFTLEHYLNRSPLQESY